jgi:DNA-binding CsgD family transcriptional regulator
MSVDGRDHCNLVVSFYDAALGSVSWNDSLSILGHIVSSRVLVLFSQVPGRTDSTFFGGIGLQPAAVQQYIDYFAARNVLMTTNVSLHREGVGRTSETICRPDVLLSSEYYNDFLRPLDIRYSAALTALRDEHCAVHVSAFREHRASAFDPRDLQVFADVYPHLRRALQIHLRLAESERQRESLEHVIGRTSRGIAFITAAGKAAYVNGAMQGMLESRDGLLLSRSGITAADPRAARALRGAVDAASRGRDGGTVDVPRLSGLEPYSVVVSPVLRRFAVTGSTDATALLVVTDPQRFGTPAADTLRKRYGLTRTEAEVATLFATGLDVHEIAARLEMSVHTARTHLKRILSKTSTSRQAALMRLLLIDLA